MKSIQKNLILTTILASLSLTVPGLSRLALIDIGHGESNLSAEWRLLRLVALVFVVLIASTLALVRGVYKTLRCS